MSEKTEQKALVKWFYYQYPNNKIMAIPNAQKFLARAKNIFAMVASLKAEGFIIGASDLFIPKAAGGYNGMFLELKDVGKDYDDVSPEQKQFILDMKREGYYADWAAGCDQAMSIIKPYMSGTL